MELNLMVPEQRSNLEKYLAPCNSSMIGMEKLSSIMILFRDRKLMYLCHDPYFLKTNKIGEE